jgi:dipeptidyl aminopeptidase/acylaminoacyl peptidase
MQRTCLAVLVALCLSCSAHAADPAPAVQVATTATNAPPPLADFLKHDLFGTIQISPTGEYLAATVQDSDRTNLVILRRSDLKPTGRVMMPAKRHVAEMYWVGDKRILFTIAEKEGELETPRQTGEIFAVDADGSLNHGPLVGYRSHNGDRATFATVIDTLHKEGEQVLVSLAFLSPYTEVDRMDVQTGQLHRIARAPVAHAHFLVDASGIVRFAAGEGDDLRLKTYYRPDANTDWELINDESQTRRRIEPKGFSADGKTAYLQAEETTGPDGIYAFDTATRTRKLLYRHPVASPVEYLQSPEDRSVYAAVFNDGRPSVQYLDPDNGYAKQLQAMQDGFKDAMVLPTSYSRDGSLALYRIYSDRIPGDYYLFDRKANSATFVASRATWFKPGMLSEMRPVNFKARDGLTIPGLLTIPRGSNGKNLPLIINPHGGPFGIADTWRYNPEVQLFASRGYAVLQVNYRGSGDYGRAFMHAGYRQWGGTMQDDLTDATHWAIDQGIADPHRICIYGSSYGGYAALEGVAKEPTLYRCAIGYVGLYDLPAHFHLSDTSEWKSGMTYLKEAMGETNLEAVSPTHLADRITVPAMLAAGSEDRRVTPKQTELMRDALTKAGKQVDAKIYSGEGHGFYTEANRTDLYTRMLAFLDRNIGPASLQAAPPADKH